MKQHRAFIDRIDRIELELLKNITAKVYSGHWLKRVVLGKKKKDHTLSHGLFMQNGTT